MTNQREMDNYQTDLVLRIAGHLNKFEGGKIPYNEGDHLEVYGEYTYPVLIGKNETQHMTVPSINGGYIEKV
jgi:hypothetical protein